MKSRSRATMPIPVRRALQKLGNNIQSARRKRRISTALMAERASISRMTLNKVEKGDPGVGLGIYGTILFVLGMTDALANLVDPTKDIAGLFLEEENLPKRIRTPKPLRRSDENKHALQKEE